MQAEPAAIASRIVRTLVDGRAADREAAQAMIYDSDQAIDREYLRKRLLEEWAKVQPPRHAKRNEDRKAAITRSWLVGTLAHVTDEDEEAAQLVRNHLQPAFEPKSFIRRWTLANLIRASAPDVTDLARQIANDKEIAQLGWAILAVESDKDEEKDAAIDKIQKGLTNKRSASLRRDTVYALRIVPLPDYSIGELCQIVSGAKYSDVTHEAILALGQVSGGAAARHAHAAARALTGFISENRHSSRRDGMRVKAVASLGNLKVENAAPILIEELYDDNPTIVREAARSLEKILGVRRVIIRVIEAATKSTPDNVEKLANAIRWMDRDAVAVVLEEYMVSGPTNQQELARRLMSEMGGAVALQKLQTRTMVTEQYHKILERAEERVRELFESTISEAQRGFKLATGMDTAIFATGILLILASAGMTLWQDNFNVWTASLTGAGGVLGVLYNILIAKPREQVKDAVHHLMYLKIVFLGYLRQLHQADQAYTRYVLEENNLSAEGVKAFSDIVGQIMSVAVRQLATVTETTLEPPTD